MMSTDNRSIAVQLAENAGKLAALDAGINGHLAALSASVEVGELLRIKAWLELDRAKVTGDTLANVKCPPSWPPGRTEEQAFDALLRPLRERLAKGGGGSVPASEAGDKYLEAFRKRLETGR